MEIINEIERAEMLHRQLCTETLSQLEDPSRGQMTENLLMLLTQVESNCFDQHLLPPDLSARLEHLLNDARFHLESHRPSRTFKSSEVMQNYAVLKKHLTAQAEQRG